MVAAGVQCLRRGGQFQCLYGSGAQHTGFARQPNRGAGASGLFRFWRLWHGSAALRVVPQWSADQGRA